MINLAEEAGAEFFLIRIWDVTLKEATLHMGESERGLGRKKYDIVFGADGAFSNSTSHAASACLITHKSF
jgi:kynurenine 3-monooxygenase